MHEDLSWGKSGWVGRRERAELGGQAYGDNDVEGWWTGELMA